MKATITILVPREGDGVLMHRAIGSFEISEAMTLVQRTGKPELEFLALTDFTLMLGGEEFVPALYNVPVDNTVHLRSKPVEAAKAKVKVTGRTISV